MKKISENHKKILCPYCTKKIQVKNMPSHIDTYHQDRIVEGLTPLQMTYHLYNKYPFEFRRKCRVCGKPTDWDESKGRYNFLCNNPKCKESWIKTMKTNIGDKNLTSNPEGLKRLLASRHISGVYKFSSGGEVTFTGSYELETLKFLDRIMDVKVEDIMVPGPIIEYEFNGEKHQYISDIYYIPYNLIIEVKDGGDNPNTNQAMALVRAKQIAKEKYVIDHTDYNYLRLTNKNFSQLMIVFTDLKMHVKDYDKSRVIHVNENMFAAVQGMMLPEPKFSEKKDLVVVNYLKKNTYTDYPNIAVSDNPKFDSVFTRENGKLIMTDKSILENSIYTPYIVRDARYVLKEYILPYIDKEIDENFIYESIFEHPMVTTDQIMLESNVEPYKDYYQTLREITEKISGYRYDFANLIEKRFGIISTNGAYNCCVQVKGYPRSMRGRSAVIIFKKFGKKWKVLLRFNPVEMDYNAPGGGWDEDEDPMDAGIREAKEEVHVNTTNVKYMGYKIEYSSHCKKWVEEHVPNEKDRWYGYFTAIFCGIYDSKYTGFVSEEDSDSMLYTARWWDVDRVTSKHSLLNKEYKEAIVNYLRDLEE